MVSNVKKYRAIWLPKVQFGEPADTNATKGYAFNTPVLEGTIAPDDSGDWKNEQTFTTEAEAKTYLEGKSGVKPQCKTPVASVASGTYAVTQSIELSAGEGESIYYTTNGLTPSSTVGALYDTPIAVSDDMMD